TVQRQLPCSVSLKLCKTNITPSDTTVFAILPTMLLQFNVPRYEAQTATSDVQWYSILRSIHTTVASSLDHTVLVFISPLFHDKFHTLPSTNPPKLMAIVMFSRTPRLLAWGAGGLVKLPSSARCYQENLSLFHDASLANTRVNLLHVNIHIQYPALGSCKFQHNNCMKIQSPDDDNMSEARHLPTD
ncbi:hypothetical protein ARMGADRAFT_1146534, partial [Armillaria gallica]